MTDSTDQAARYIVIMAGGRGERFWPLSREQSPKQLLRILGSRSFLQEAVDRARALTAPENVFIITNQAQLAATREQTPELPGDNVIAEPCGRDTCAAVALGAALVGARDQNAVMAILPADHVIPDPERFNTVLGDAMDHAARSGSVVTIGIEPTEPATGYGYIECGEAISDATGSTAIYQGLRFVEKPNLEKATEYLQSGRYRWNAGMFVWRLDTIAEAFEKNVPEMAASMKVWSKAASEGSLDAQLEKDYPTIQKISIDFALMEKLPGFAVADGAFDWDDLGAWTALPRHITPDDSGNCVRGTAVSVDAQDNIIFDARTTDQGPVGLVGVSGLVIALTDDATLIASQDQAQKIKDLVKKLGTLEAFRHLT